MAGMLGLLFDDPVDPWHVCNEIVRFHSVDLRRDLVQAADGPSGSLGIAGRRVLVLSPRRPGLTPHAEFSHC